MISRRAVLQSVASVAAAFGSGAWPAHASNAPGVTETEIKIGQTMAYSGPVSAYGVIGKTDAAYFEMINESGRVNGRKLRLISFDVNAGGILHRVAGGKVQQGRKQKGPRYRGPFCFSQFSPERRRPLAVRTWPDGSCACFGRA